MLRYLRRSVKKKKMRQIQTRKYSAFTGKEAVSKSVPEEAQALDLLDNRF